MRVYPVAASVSVAPVLAGAPRPVTVVAGTGAAVYLETGDPRCPALCLAGPEAVRVPCALVLPAGVPVPDGGGRWVAGGGGLRCGDVTFRVARWWRPPRPRGLVPTERLLAAAGHLAARVPDPLDAAGRVALDALVRALGGEGEVTVERLVGRGPGLTPVGDDVLAGMLVTLAATGSPAVARLRAAVGRAVPGRTTAVSAALLWHAVRGECIPQLADLLTSLADGSPDADALVAVGHTSGAGLVHGVVAACAVRDGVRR